MIHDLLAEIGYLRAIAGGCAIACVAWLAYLGLAFLIGGGT